MTELREGHYRGLQLGQAMKTAPNCPGQSETERHDACAIASGDTPSERTSTSAHETEKQQTCANDPSGDPQGTGIYRGQLNMYLPVAHVCLLGWMCGVG
jgi:hypothetical protein